MTIFASPGRTDMVVGALFKHRSLRFPAPDTLLRCSCDTFRDLLGFDIQHRELMAELERLCSQGRREDLAARARYDKPSADIQAMLSAPERVPPGRTAALRKYCIKYAFCTRMLPAPPERFLVPPWVVAATGAPGPSAAAFICPLLTGKTVHGEKLSFPLSDSVTGKYVGLSFQAVSAGTNAPAIPQDRTSAQDLA